MGFAYGIAGLPNVGKSTLFNALAATAAAEAANYPFTTIEPNTGRVAVPDERLDAVAGVAKPGKVTPAQLEIVDIAGLVTGAATGEGLGNRFLGHIREVDAILHVLRCFEGGGVTHVAGKVDPVADAEVVETELLLADLEGMERRVEAAAKRAAGGDRDARAALGAMEKVRAGLRDGVTAARVALDEGEARVRDGLGLLTAKPVLYLCNVDEADAATGNEHSRRVAELAARDGRFAVVLCCALEADVAALDDAAERREYLAAAGLTEPGLHKVIRAGYALLGLITFFTTGPREARAWTVPKGARAVEAAAVIHTDFARGFIRAETIGWRDFVACGGEAGARAAGKMRSEGKDYVVRDGDLMLFRFNV